MKKLSRKSQITLYGILVFSWMALIFLYSAQNAEESTQSSFGVTRFVFDVLKTVKIITASNYDSPEFVATHGAIRTAGHFTEYLIFGVFAFLFSRASIARKPSDTVWMPVVFCSFYALTDEVHQYFVPGRAMQLTDWLVDFCGIILAVLLMYRITAKTRKKNTL